jgi:hypothetical protein
MEKLLKSSRLSGHNFMGYAKLMRLNNGQMNNIAEWCCERQILSDKIDFSIIKSACKSIGIEFDSKLDLYEVKEIGSLTEMLYDEMDG